MISENPIVIEDREELIFMLSEASQLEHMIMLQYLFAAFGMKRDVSEGLTPEQLDAVSRWERVVIKVATQEMLHLTSATNLLLAIGAAPYFQRPNFPQMARYYPRGIDLVLAPFSEASLRHFLFLERPEGMDLTDSPDFPVVGDASALADEEEIVPEMQDFATVGHLYRGIEQGFRHLVDKFGEARVFIGPPRAQATRKNFGWRELNPVVDLASAIAAIEVIVEQGEGARGDWNNSHYGRFLAVSDEFRALKAQDPGFEPSRPVIPAFVRLPADSPAVTLIQDPQTARVSSLFNGCYEVMLQLLLRYFIHDSETDEQLKALVNAGVDLMFIALEPLGQLLTSLPVGASAPGKTAGPSFEMFRRAYLLPHQYAAWCILRDRLQELAAYARRTASPETSAVMTDVSSGLEQLAGKLDGFIDPAQNPAAVQS
ncbi:MAG: ferritin-like domain-containing protein [Rudaea sp.]